MFGEKKWQKIWEKNKKGIIGLIDIGAQSTTFNIIENGKLKISENATAQQRTALEKIGKLLETHGSTGVQKVIEQAVFNLLNCIDVYPVENENTWANSKGSVLPDVYLVPNGTTAKELASIVHTDLAKNFIAAIDARKKMKVKEDYVLKKGDVIKIVAGK